MLLLTFFACPDSTEKPEGDTADAAFCSDAPEVTWDTFGNGFMATYCTACHSVVSTNRYGAPAGMDFDTVEGTWAWADEILVAAVQEGTEPPGGGVSDSDLSLLEAWLRCAPEGT